MGKRATAGQAVAVGVAGTSGSDRAVSRASNVAPSCPTVRSTALPTGACVVPLTGGQILIVRTVPRTGGAVVALSEAGAEVVGQFMSVMGWPRSPDTVAPAVSRADGPSLGLFALEHPVSRTAKTTPGSASLFIPISDLSSLGRRARPGRSFASPARQSDGDSRVRTAHLLSLIHI